MSSDIKELKECNEKILHSIKKLENTSKGADEEFINVRIFNLSYYYFLISNSFLYADYIF